MTFTGPNAIPDPPKMVVEAKSVDEVEKVVKAINAMAKESKARIPAAQAKHLATQTQYPWRTSVRTGVATLLLLLGAAAAVTANPTVGGFIGAHFPNLLPKVVAAGVFCGALATVLKRIGSIPAVAKLFVRLGLGVVPKSALK